MAKLKLITNSPEQTQELGRRLGKLALPGDVFLLTGELGAGKTCLTQGIAWGLGSEEYALSPTFVIMRELYPSGEGLPLYHVDLYRLDRLEESQDLGLDDYLYGNGVCVVEWADKALSILPKNHLLIKIGYVSDTERSFQIEASGERYLEILDRLRDYVF